MFDTIDKILFTCFDFRRKAKNIISLSTNLLVVVTMIGLSIYQAAAQTTPSNSRNKITIHSENSQIIDATIEPPIQYLNGDVKVFHSGTFMYCDTAILRDNKIWMYHNVVLIQNDTIKIFSDSLQYNGDIQMAFLYGDIILENGPTKKLYTSYLRYDVKNKIGYYDKNAKLVDQNSTLVSRKGKYLLNENTAFFYENVSITGEDFLILSDSLSYNTKSQVSTFLAPVKITKDTSQLFSEKGFFNLQTKSGDFFDNAQYLKKNTLAKADTITYDGINDVVILKSNVKRSEYISDKDTAYAKTIYFDQKNKVFTLTKDAYYKSDKNEVTGESIFYDQIKDKFKTSGKSVISDAPYIISADQLDYDKNIKFGIADGNVVWRDTSAKTTLIADHVRYRGSENYIKATNDVGRPLFITKMDADSLYMKADTLTSYRSIKEVILYPDKKAARLAKLEKEKVGLDKDKLNVDINTENNSDIVAKVTSTSRDSTTIDSALVSRKSVIISGLTDSLAVDSIMARLHIDTIYTGVFDTMDYFIGDGNVRMYKNDMQAICDSLAFNKTDSIFTLFNTPFVWSDSTQIAGDTIQLFMKNKVIDKLAITENSTIVSTEDDLFYNQIQGKFIEAQFVENKMKTMKVAGNAKIVYYLLDEEKAYIGVNTTESSSMTFLFENNKVLHIKCYKEPNSKVYPMLKANHESIKIKGFKWNITARPLTREDI